MIQDERTLQDLLIQLLTKVGGVEVQLTDVRTDLTTMSENIKDFRDDISEIRTWKHTADIRLRALEARAEKLEDADDTAQQMAIIDAKEVLRRKDSEIKHITVRQDNWKLTIAASVMSAVLAFGCSIVFFLLTR